jgi:hypothetical protein
MDVDERDILADNSNEFMDRYWRYSVVGMDGGSKFYLVSAALGLVAYIIPRLERAVT